MKDYPEDESKNWEFVSLNMYGPFKGKTFLFSVRRKNACDTVVAMVTFVWDRSKVKRSSSLWESARDTVQCVVYLLPW